VPLLGDAVGEVIMTDLQRMIRQNRREAREEGRQEDRQEGLQEGRQALMESILAIFSARGLVLSLDLYDKLTACPDVSLLKHWLSRALVASCAEEAIGKG
jgi:hypothetical protein